MPERQLALEPIGETVEGRQVRLVAIEYRRLGQQLEELDLGEELPVHGAAHPLDLVCRYRAHGGLLLAQEEWPAAGFTDTGSGVMVKPEVLPAASQVRA